MIRLIGDIGLHISPCWCADRKSGIAFLPGERLFIDLIMYPNRSRFLQFTHEIRQTMGCLQTDKQVDMIGNSPDAFRDSTKSVNCSAQVLEQSRTPRFSNPGLSIFCAENNVVMQAEIGGRHVRGIFGK